MINKDSSEFSSHKGYFLYFKKINFSEESSIQKFIITISENEGRVVKFDSTYYFHEHLTLIGFKAPKETLIKDRVYFQTEEMMTRFNNSLKKKK